MPFVVYSFQRLGLFAAALLALWSLRLGGWLLVVLAAFLAWAVSYLALTRSRDRAALWVAERVERRRTGPRFSEAVDEDALVEDAEADAIGRAADPPGGRRRSEGQAEAQQDPVAELERPGPGQDGPEQHTARPGEDGRGEQADRQREQQHEE